MRRICFLKPISHTVCRCSRLCSQSGHSISHVSRAEATRPRATVQVAHRRKLVAFGKLRNKEVVGKPRECLSHISILARRRWLTSFTGLSDSSWLQAFDCFLSRDRRRPPFISLLRQHVLKFCY